jgi:steroid 5-alpha reductase family enzyme
MKEGDGMRNSDTRAILSSSSLVIVAALVAFAASRGESVGVAIVGDLPLIFLCMMISFAIQWLVFIPSYLYKTEKYFDLTGGLTFLSLTAVILLLTENRTIISYLLAILIAIWAIRLSSFLFLRIREDGHDKRFTEVIPDKTKFLFYWTFQGFWAFITPVVAFTAIGSQNINGEIEIMTLLGLVIWLIGFCIEVIADRQKRKFRKTTENKSRFISSGLWAWSRHPNYFGEIILWIGVLIIALPTLIGWQYVTVLSVPYVIIMLTKVSGVIKLEKASDQKWGTDEAYQKYKTNTPTLIPRRPR